MPIILQISYAKINERWVAFYDASSLVVHWGMIKEYIKEKFNALNSDAMNFHNCINHIKELNEKPHIYPSGFTVGDEVEIIKHSEKYNRHIVIDIGSTAEVIDPPAKVWPKDAVEIKILQSNGLNGMGSVDADSIRRI